MTNNKTANIGLGGIQIMTPETNFIHKFWMYKLFYAN